MIKRLLILTISLTAAYAWASTNRGLFNDSCCNHPERYGWYSAHRSCRNYVDQQYFGCDRCFD